MAIDKLTSQGLAPGAVTINSINDNEITAAKLHTTAIQDKLGFMPVTKEYVDGVAEGLKSRPSVEIATTTNLSATYDNGTNGVGATLTATTNGAFPEIDGVTLTSTNGGTNGVLVKNQTNGAQNGRYNLTTVGNVSTPWVLTRCGLCDQSNEIPGSYTFVKRGTINAGSGWVQVVANAETFTVGTDNVIVTQFSGVGTYSAGTGLSLVGYQFSMAEGAAVANIGYTPVNTASLSTSNAINTVVLRDSNGDFASRNVTVNRITTNEITGAGSPNTQMVGTFRLSSGSTLHATYADLAEYYEADSMYEVGEVVVFGGEREVTTTNNRGDHRVAGVISNTAAYVMNADCPGNKALIALQGRVPCKVIGQIYKGDLMITSDMPGVAISAGSGASAGTIIGKALENYDSAEVGVIEVAVGRA
jgi:hypothetical protein